MVSSTCFLRERSLCFVWDDEVRELEENHKLRSHGEMSGLLNHQVASGNLVIQQARFWINKEKRLMGEVILPRAEGPPRYSGE